MYIKLWNAHKKMYNYEEISKKNRTLWLSDVVVIIISGPLYFGRTPLQLLSIGIIIYLYFHDINTHLQLQKFGKKIAMDNKIVAFWLKNHEDDCPIPLL